MNVDGIDPMVLNSVKDQATKSPVQEAERADTQRARTKLLREQQVKARQQEAVAVRGHRRRHAAGAGRSGT